MPRGPVSQRARDRELSERQLDVVVGATLCLIAGALYVATCCPTIYWYDSAEFVVAGASLGIPHAPGYPVYVWLAHLFTRLPLDTPYAVNLMSAVFAALDVGLLFAVARHGGASRPAAAIGAAWLAGGAVFWHNAVVAEVYTPGLFGLLTTWWLALEARRRGSWPVAWLAAFVAGLSLGLHYFVATTGLGLAWMVYATSRPEAATPGEILRRRPSLRELGAMLACGPAVLLGASVFAWLPYRAAQHPVINFGVVDDPARFSAYLRGAGFHHLFQEVSPGARALELATTIATQLGVVGVGVAVLGLVVGIRRRPVEALAVTLGCLGNLWFFFRYVVHDDEVFFLPTVALLALAAAWGVDAIAGEPAGLTTEADDGTVPAPDPRARARALATRLGAGAAATVALALTLPRVDRAEDRSAEAYGEAIVEQLPPESVILFYQRPEESVGASVFLVYHKLFLGDRPDVHVVNAPPPQVVAQMLSQGYGVYVFAPVPEVRAHFALIDQRPLARVAFREPPGEPGAPPRPPPP